MVSLLPRSGQKFQIIRGVEYNAYWRARWGHIVPHCQTVTVQVSRARTHPAITMASLFVRSLTRSTRTSTSLRSSQHSFFTSNVRKFEQKIQHDKSSFDYHTVEDLQGMTAQEILAESGTRQDEKMRHFTGMCLWTVYSSVNSQMIQWILGLWQWISRKDRIILP